VLAWLSVWSEVQMICIWFSWCHCHPIISCISKIQNGLSFWYQSTQVVLEKRPLNVCVVCAQGLELNSLQKAAATRRMPTAWTAYDRRVWYHCGHCLLPSPSTDMRGTRKPENSRLVYFSAMATPAVLSEINGPTLSPCNSLWLQTTCQTCQLRWWTDCDGGGRFDVSVTLYHSHL